MISAPSTFIFASGNASEMIIPTGSNYSAGAIVQINSYDENMFVYSLMSSRGAAASWIAGQLHGPKSKWVYGGAVFYAPLPIGNLSYTAWAPGNPTNSPTFAHCITMNATFDSSQSWLDSSCDGVSAYIIEYSPSKAN